MAIFTHVCVGTNNLEGATKFYTAALAPLGVNNLGPMGDHGTLFGGAEGPEFLVTKPSNGNAACYANGGTVGFKAASREAVRQFHAAGLANGGTDEGAPGPRTFTPTAYAAYLRDADGNKITAYCFNDGE
jgi:catechol 2,3-dioxygenase-like lactoylglutathione lyase family enzyme